MGIPMIKMKWDMANHYGEGVTSSNILKVPVLHAVEQHCLVESKENLLHL